jgi:hypothetical protein
MAHRLTRGWPFFIFHAPGVIKSKAPTGTVAYTHLTMSGYYRPMFSSWWHAGGTCVNFFLHVLSVKFPTVQKNQVSLALGWLWLIWAATNSWRTVYGEAQVCQMEAAFHSLTGPGCGLLAYWHLVHTASCWFRVILLRG